ncbi:hypothetical protein SAMN04487979_104284 [Flavobacterium sp. ov086]|nr:hypothetical protein SAMN04487979_104284 [Flavobacterium sp. ov086]
MNLETTILIYWLILLGVSYAIAKKYYYLNNTIIYSKQLENWTISLFYFLKFIGIGIVCSWIFLQLIHIVFKDILMFISEILNP